MRASCKVADWAAACSLAWLRRLVGFPKLGARPGEIFVGNRECGLGAKGPVRKPGGHLGRREAADRGTQDQSQHGGGEINDHSNTLGADSVAPAAGEHLVFATDPVVQFWLSNAFRV